MEEERRVLSIGYNIYKANVDICPVFGYATGMYIWNKYYFERENRSIAKRVFNIGETLQIKHIMPGSPADVAGLQVGDRLVSLNDKDINKGRYAYRDFYRNFNKLFKDQTVNLVVQRGTQNIPVTLSRDKICGFGLVYDETAMEINASANGHRVKINRGYYKFTENDDELAEVIGHELAHNAMLHINKGQWNSAIPILAGIAIDMGNVVNGTNIDSDDVYDIKKYTDLIYSPSFEREADYVGMYMIARAGYDTSKAAHVWRRSSAEDNGGGIEVDILNSHPSNPDRFVSMEKTHKEIMHKKRHGLPLLPKMEQGKTLPLVNPPAIRKGDMH
ncbi:M48 family metalloprotease [Micavibrio aeruginosavorus]|uniref:M48 family metallopeptidase n=1 Tax=Micavibrio aeruginosavorus TaxID=349221 RepID=UPI003F4AB1B1